jgi:predicted HAD superfamily Cof-like phosphohydrolase
VRTKVALTGRFAIVHDAAISVIVPDGKDQEAAIQGRTLQ